jgi:TolB-like protein
MQHKEFFEDKMKKLVFCLILGFTAGVVFGQANVPTIVVSTFSTRGQTVTRDDAEGITELFMAELAKQSGVRVVDRTRLDRVVAEMRFQASDWSNSQKTAQLGAALNAEVLVRGQINQLGQQISIAITALDIKTLEVVSSYTRNFNSDTIFSNGNDGLFNYLKTMASSIANPIKDKMGPNYFIGRWQTANGNCILEFRADGTMRVERFVIYDGSTSYSGTGVYSYKNDSIEIKLNLQGKEFTTFNSGTTLFGKYWETTWVDYTFNAQKNSFSFSDGGLWYAYWGNGSYSFYKSFVKIR